MGKRGRFITLEGIDGAGKSTHLPYITNILQDQKIPYIATREPGGTPLGESLRKTILQENHEAHTQSLLIFAARHAHIKTVIEPALAQNIWVISDRFTDASFAYQGGGLGVSQKKLSILEEWTHPHLQPDLSFLFDLPCEIAKARCANRKIASPSNKVFESKADIGQTTFASDKFEEKTTLFFTKVRAAYLHRAAQFSQRFHVLDATESIPAIQNLLKKILLPLIAAHHACRDQ